MNRAGVIDTMNRKAKGSRVERKSRDMLERCGYLVIKSAASLTPFDLVAIGASDVLLIQCKANRWPSAEEIKCIKGVVAPANCRKMIYRWRDRVSAPDVREVD